MAIPAFTRIRVRILGIVMLAIIPAMILIFYFAAKRKQEISREIEGNARRLSQFLASNLERDIAGGKGFLAAAAQSLAARPPEKADCETALSALLGNSPVYANLGLARTDGEILCSAVPIPREGTLAKLEWFGKVRKTGRFAVGFDITGILGKQASINLAMPFPGKGTSGDRLLFAVMNLDWLNRLAEKSNLPKGSAISVRNQRGDAIARYPDPDKWVGKPYPKELLDGQEIWERNGIQIAAGVDGVKRLYASSAIGGEGGLVAVVGILREAQYAPANRSMYSHLAALGAVSLLAILAAWFASDVFLLKQVNALIAATRKLTRGDLGARSELSYHQGELGELARAFDEMAETLAWREAQLSEAEIERFNLENLFKLAEIAPEPILLMDGAGTVEAANPAMREAFGLEDEELHGRSLFAIFPELQARSLEVLPLLEAGSHPAPRSRLATGFRRRKDGVTFSVEVSLSRAFLVGKPVLLAILHIHAESALTTEKA